LAANLSTLTPVLATGANHGAGGSPSNNFRTSLQTAGSLSSVHIGKSFRLRSGVTSIIRRSQISNWSST